jgi:hypothetical protein
VRNARVDAASALQHPITTIMAATERLPKTFRSDADVLAQHHRFIRTIEDDQAVLSKHPPAELRLARRYYDRLFKEYAIADLSLAQKRRDEERQLAREVAEAEQGENADSLRRRLADLKSQPPPQIGLRWRTRAEVVSGRGHLSCGNRACSEKAALSTFEVPFSWVEIGAEAPRSALVKVRLCPRCAALLPRGRGGGQGSSGRGRERREEVEARTEPTTTTTTTTTARRRQAAARSRSRSPPPRAVTEAAAERAAPAAAATAPAEGKNDEADDARLDRLVQDMIDAFEAGAG